MVEVIKIENNWLLVVPTNWWRY